VLRFGKLQLLFELQSFCSTLAGVPLSSSRTTSASMRSFCYDLYKHKLLVSKQVKIQNRLQTGKEVLVAWVKMCCNVYSDPPSFSLDVFPHKLHIFQPSSVLLHDNTPLLCCLVRSSIRMVKSNSILRYPFMVV
jgi:hypothetical protein